jgi:glycosyltransferase involved in cell wall biosynthesis
MKFWDGPKIIRKNGVTMHGLCKARPLYTKSGRRSILQPIIFGLSCLKLSTEKFDVIDCCGFPYFSIFPCRLIAWAKRKPLYATWHEVWGKKYWKEYLGILGLAGYVWERFAILQPDEFIAVSYETAEKLRKLRPNRKIHVIENSVDVDHIRKLPKANHASDLIFAGRLADTKHVDQLISAVAKIRKTYNNILLTVVGDGPERKNLELLANKLKLEKNVLFTGFFENHDDMLRYVKASKMFVLPSSREGFGIVVIEANAAGIPVITVDEPDNFAQKLISEDNGVVTKLHSEDLAAAIIRILEKPVSASKCIQVARRYDVKHTMDKLKEVLV